MTLWRVSDNTRVSGPFTWNLQAGVEGWKTFALPAAVAIAANTDYVVAVSNGPDRYYSGQPGGFDAPIVNGHLRTYTGSGVYGTAPGAMPGSVWQNTNYFRDVIFVPDL